MHVRANFEFKEGAAGLVIGLIIDSGLGELSLVRLGPCHDIQGQYSKLLLGTYHGHICTASCPWLLKIKMLRACSLRKSTVPGMGLT